MFITWRLYSFETPQARMGKKSLETFSTSFKMLEGTTYKAAMSQDQNPMVYPGTVFWL